MPAPTLKFPKASVAASFLVKGGFYDRQISNGMPISADFAEALQQYIELAKSQGSQCTEEEIVAAFEVMLMNAVGIQPTEIAIEKSKRVLNEVESKN